MYSLIPELRTKIFNLCDLQCHLGKLPSKGNLWYFINYYQILKWKMIITSNRRIVCAIYIKEDPINI